MNHAAAFTPPSTAQSASLAAAIARPDRNLANDMLPGSPRVAGAASLGRGQQQPPYLTYYQVHMYLTLPVLVLLYLLVRPILHPRLDPVKLVFLSVLAFVYTTPWDNWIISRGAWSYCAGCTLGITFGTWIPLEEYMFFVIQSLTSGFIGLAVLNTGRTPAELMAGVVLDKQNREPIAARRAHVKSLGYVAIAALWTPSAAYLAGWLPEAAIAAVLGAFRQWFYLAAILAWSLPVLALQWSLASEYMMANQRRALTAVIISTAYLCVLDWFALNAGAWTIERNSTLGIDVLFPGLPLEEAVFFLITNCMLVGGLLTCDQTFARLHLAGKLHTSHVLPLTTQIQLWATYTLSPPALDATVLSDTLISSRLIRHGSRSFHLASMCFPWDLRADIHALYAFCRVTDDVADNPDVPIQARRAALQLVQEWLADGLDADAAESVASHVHAAQHEPPAQTAAAMRAVSRIRRKYAMPVQPLLDLIRGYMWDLDGKQVESVEDVVKYAELVAGTVGEASTAMMVQWDRFGTEANKTNGKAVDSTTMRRAVDLGVSLQLVNIARDLVTDADMGRCYVPRAFWPTDGASAVPVDNDAALHAIAAQLVGLAQTYMSQALDEGVPRLPARFKPAVVLAARVYGAIGDELFKAGKRGERYPKRMVVGRMRKVWEAVRAVYGNGF